MKNKTKKEKEKIINKNCVDDFFNQLEKAGFSGLRINQKGIIKPFGKEQKKQKNKNQ